MKIFSLQTKKHLVGWSMGLGIVVNILISLATLKSYQPICSISFLGPCTKIYTFGFPLNNEHRSGELLIPLLDAIFWIIVSLIILSLIRFFKSKPS